VRAEARRQAEAPIRTGLLAGTGSRGLFPAPARGGASRSTWRDARFSAKWLADHCPLTPPIIPHLKDVRIRRRRTVLVKSYPADTLTLMAGLALLIPAWFGLFLTGVPTILCPMPMLTTVPAFLLSTWRLQYVAIGLPVLLFFIWRPGFFRGAPQVPSRSYILLAIVMVLSIIWFISGWSFGLRYQGAGYTSAVLVVNVGWAAVLLFAFVRTWKKGASFGTSLFVHWMLFAWLTWYAFPYLGELP
jgi:hypothetical protein